MKRDLPRYVVRLKGVLYFKRAHWPTRKFKAQEIGPAFYAEYATILNGTAPKPKAFLVEGLVISYYESKKFQRLKPRTKKDYRKYLDRFSRNAGAIPVAQIERKHVIAWRDQLEESETPHFANYFVRTLRVVLEYAIDIGEIQRNPAKGVESARYEKTKVLPWPKEKITAVREARPHDDRTRLLFELLYCTGQRIGDVLKMKWADIRGDSIHVLQGKTGAELTIPLTEDLQECLRRADRSGETILTRDASKHVDKEPGPLSYRSASHAIRKLRDEIGAKEYTIHGIRHTVASEIGATGSDAEVMAITGHSTSAMVRHYAGSARQEARAKDAQKKRK